MSIRLVYLQGCDTVPSAASTGPGQEWLPPEVSEEG